jgi:hypothetical protein
MQRKKAGFVQAVRFLSQQKTPGKLRLNNENATLNQYIVNALCIVN